MHLPTEGKHPSLQPWLLYYGVRECAIAILHVQLLIYPLVGCKYICNFPLVPMSFKSTTVCGDPQRSSVVLWLQGNEY